MSRWLWQGKPWQAFKTFAILFSFTLNFLFLVVLLLIAPYLIPAMQSLARPLVGGLNASFEEMGNAHIVQSIRVDDTVPVIFTLPVSTTTTVRVTEPIPLQVPTTFTLPGGGGVINGQVTLVLPADLRLPVQMNLTVPVSQTIPIQLAVPVNIPLAETQLGGPFSDLQALFTPLNDFLGRLPTSNEELRERMDQSAQATEEIGD